ncbi:hypothetical protein HJG60_010459 [Phyllostomus discolor]|uniref:Uncharacterized protein n=1 Tax=Phyllostomus discolor TaxID=89673 RepID=A0A834EB72_9CHIR|nr:hypothetical protein HJG60_010459 [Phyllostomus discolor]
MPDVQHELGVAQVRARTRFPVPFPYGAHARRCGRRVTWQPPDERSQHPPLLFPLQSLFCHSWNQSQRVCTVARSCGQCCPQRCPPVLPPPPPPLLPLPQGAAQPCQDSAARLITSSPDLWLLKTELSKAP